MRITHVSCISAERPMAAQTTGLQAKAEFLQGVMTTFASNYQDIINNIKFKDWAR